MSRYWQGVYFILTEYGLPTDLARQVWTIVRNVIGYSPEWWELDRDYRDIIEAALDELIPEPPDEPEEWEVTVAYNSIEKKNVVEDITVRMLARSLRRYQREEVRAAFWWALVHQPSRLTDWDMHLINWRDYQYPTGRIGVDEALANAAGIFKTVGMDGLRVELVS